jgi:hypothetical protein
VLGLDLDSVETPTICSNYLYVLELDLEKSKLGGQTEHKSALEEQDRWEDR